MAEDTVQYANSGEQWPDDPARGERRCQHEVLAGRRCGLPAAEPEDGGRPRCLLHGGKAAGVTTTQGLEYAVAHGADLTGARLAGFDLSGLNLSGAKLDGADLSRCNLRGVDLRGASLRGATLTEAKIEGHADLRSADLSGADLRGMYLDPEARAADVRWTRGDGDVICIERQAREALAGRKDEEALDLFGAAERLYRQIKRNYQEAGDYHTAGRFFIREMECQRAQMSIRTPANPKASGYQRLLWWGMYHGAGYGEWPGRIIISAMAFVLFFAFLHAYVCGFSDGVHGVHVGPGIDWIPSVEGFWAFMSAVYFSMVTFTSLGYGDIHPINGYGRAAASVEVFVGVLTMSLILVTIVRRWSR
jgi:hypothetical protein